MIKHSICSLLSDSTRSAQADLEKILVESIQLETENITLKDLIRSYQSKPEMANQLKKMLHYNQQVFFLFLDLQYKPSVNS